MRADIGCVAPASTPRGGRYERDASTPSPRKREREFSRGLDAAPLLEVVDLHKTFQLARQSWFKPHPLRRAVDGVSFVVQAGRSFGVVGESGSGKTTLARAIMALAKPTSGAVRLEGHSLFDFAPAKLKALRAHFQMIFQDPYGSLDPRHTIERIVAEPLANLERVGRAARRRRVDETLAEVGLDAAAAKKYPHEFSGGQRQRIAIARALITRPNSSSPTSPCRRSTFRSRLRCSI